MSEPGTPQAMHLGEASLQRFADGELGPSDMAAIRSHLAACGECSARLDSLTQAAVLYLDYHRDTLKALDPAPPRSWEDLRPKLAAINGASSPARGGQWRGWLAAAAAILLAVTLYYRMNRPNAVSAADLLRRAAAVEAPPNPARRIRIRTARRSVVRPAVLSAAQPAAGDPGLEALFLAAHFNWQDPLSVRAFTAWRDQLPQKEDLVRVSPGAYEIHTTTQSGPLGHAVLVLHAGDLHPVSETLQFAGERVEIAEADAATVPGTPPTALPAPAGSSSALPAVPPAAGPAQELHAIAALHAIGADLGEPVQVTRQGASLFVEIASLTPAREQQVRDAVAAVPGVTVRSDVPDAAPMDGVPGPRLATAAGVRTRLEGILGEDGVNRILDASEAVMARVYALRGLSRRFPLPVEAQLADADRSVLAAIRSGHVSGIETHLRALESALAPLLPAPVNAPPKTPPAAASPPAPWQERAGVVFAAAQQVDRLLNRILAGGEDFTRQAPALAEALHQLDLETAAEARQ